MLSRTVSSSLALLIFAIMLLAMRVTPAQAHPSLALTPPPIASQAVRVGPPTIQPTVLITEPITGPITVTGTVTGSFVPSSTSAISITPAISNAQPIVSVTAQVPSVIIVRPTPPALILPTVTPTPGPVGVLLPTPTATPFLASPTPTSIKTPTSLPSPTPSATRAAISETTAITDTVLVTQTIAPTGAPVGTSALTETDAITDISIGLPSPLVTVSVPLPISYLAEGSFASQTVYTDSTIAQQQGNFTILQSADLNAYGANQHYTLRTQRAVGELDEINVYQIDDYIAVNYTGSDWMLVRRDQGSNIVRAIQPITDLAVLFPRVIDQAEFIGQEDIGGISSLRYRIDDPSGQGARLIQPLLALTGEIRSLNLDVWIAVPGGFVVAYNFQVELAGARVLDANLNEGRADQAVTWTYQLTPSAKAQPIPWPIDAPAPDAFPVPGFSPGGFPMPPNTELLSFVGGVPDLVSTQTPVQLDSFFRTELLALGWTVEGEGGLLQCNKEGTSFQLLITADTASNGTRISILPGE